MRVRFAPSPTGSLHLGGLRTALFNFLYAKSTGGRFILRIEDTDCSRSVPGSMERIIETLEWAGLFYDEGPGKSGIVSSFIQSERLDVYQKYAQHLLDAGTAYKCYCPKSPSREKHDNRCRAAKRTKGSSYVVRLAAPEFLQRKSWKDMVYGEIEYGRLDDIILIKSDGFPTYHFANVVDDHEMKIDAILRGQEWLPSTPIHKYLYSMFDWPDPPTYHLPLLKNQDNSKLSKRQNSARVDHYREQGFLPESLVNFTAFLGWTPSVYFGGREILSLPELSSAFKPKDINKSDATVDIKRLEWFNKRHLAKFEERGVSALHELMPSFSREYLKGVFHLLKERVSSIQDIPRLGSYFFKEPDICSSVLSDSLKIDYLCRVEGNLENIKDWNRQSIADSFQCAKEANASRLDSKELMLTARQVFTGVQVGANLSETLCLLGRQCSLDRIKKYTTNRICINKE